MFAFVGTRLLSQSTGSVDPLNAPTALAMFFIALPIIWADRQRALRCARYNTLLLTVIAFSLLSVGWSDYPILTLKRAILLVCISTAAFAIAIGIREFRSFHTTVFVFLLGLIIANIVFTFTNPEVAIEGDLGVKGLHSQKNLAGMIAMIAVLVSVSWLANEKSFFGKLAGIAAVGLAAVFLFWSESKTSIALCIVALLALSVMSLLSKLGSVFAMGLLGFMFIAVSGVLLFSVWIDFNIETALTIITGDASLTGRDELWYFILGKIEQRPLLGYGYGAFWDIGEANDPLSKLEPGTWLGDIQAGIINHAHNGFLELALQVGMPAMVIATIAVIIRIASSMRVEKGAPGNFDHMMSHGLTGLMLIIYLIHNITESSLVMRNSGLFMFVLLLSFVETARWVGRSSPLGSSIGSSQREFQ
ncbi:MAG: O-antigen ligase family protein [Hyphomicrobiaceae bacterium]